MPSSHGAFGYRSGLACPYSRAMRTRSSGRGAVIRALVIALVAPTILVAVPPAAGAVVGEPPDPVTNLTASANVGEVKLTWTNPSTPDWTETVVRGAAGAVPPAGPEDGFAVPPSGELFPGPQATATDLGPNLAYSFAAFAKDAEGLYAAPAVVTVDAMVVTASVAPDRTTYGKEVTISGRVVDALSGTPQEYADVRVLAHQPGPSDEVFLVAEDFTRADGRFAIPVAPATALEFGVVAIGDTAHLGGFGVTRAVAVSSAVYLEPVTKRGKLGTRFVLFGGADPIATDVPLVLQEKVRKKKWKTVFRQRPNTKGITKFKITPKTRGKHVYRVTRAATPGVGSGTSRQVTITVT